jgi:hypothetical protein
LNLRWPTVYKVKGDALDETWADNATNAFVKRFRGRMSGGPEHAMTPQEFAAAYPKMLDWIHETLASYRKAARTVASMQFARLPLYFGNVLLQDAHYVPINRVPIPPLSTMGLKRFAFVQGDSDGITYLNTYFLKRRHVSNEALHFHELIHVIQWQSLGPERFLKTYAEGLERFGYENSPLEKMAYEAEDLFKRGRPVFDAKRFVTAQLFRLGA